MNALGNYFDDHFKCEAGEDNLFESIHRFGSRKVIFMGTPKIDLSLNTNDDACQANGTNHDSVEEGG
jgi:hypothetical protein